jgi:hypothetical protein
MLTEPVAAPARSSKADPAGSSFPLPRIPFWRVFVQRVTTSMPLLLVDLGMALAGVAVARRCVEWFAIPVGSEPYLGVWIALLLLGMCWAGLYPVVGWNPVDEMRRGCLSILAACGLFAVLTSMLKGSQPGLWMHIGLTTCLWLISLPLGRRLARALCSRWTWWGQSVLIGGNPGR